MFVHDSYGNSFMDVFYGKPYTFSGKVLTVSSLYPLVNKHKYLPVTCYVMCTRVSFAVKFKYCDVHTYVYEYTLFFFCLCVRIQYMYDTGKVYTTCCNQRSTKLVRILT